MIFLGIIAIIIGLPMIILYFISENKNKTWLRIGILALIVVCTYAPEALPLHPKHARPGACLFYPITEADKPDCKEEVEPLSPKNVDVPALPPFSHQAR